MALPARRRDVFPGDNSLPIERSVFGAWSSRMDRALLLSIGLSIFVHVLVLGLSMPGGSSVAGKSGSAISVPLVVTLQQGGRDVPAHPALAMQKEDAPRIASPVSSSPTRNATSEGVESHPGKTIRGGRLSNLPSPHYYSAQDLEVQPFPVGDLSAAILARIPDGDPFHLDVELWIDQSGQAVEVIHEDSVIDQEVAQRVSDALKTVHFSPGQRQGMAVSARLSMRIAIRPPPHPYWRDHSAQKIFPP